MLLSIRTNLVHRDPTGFWFNSFEVMDPGPDRLDTCDCHHLVWSVDVLSYNWAADSYVCPIMQGATL